MAGFKLRQGTSGGLITGPDGARLIYNASTGLWDAESVVQAYDYIVRNRADLIAIAPPAEGTIALPNGSYAVKGTVTLEADEYLLVDDGALLFLHGMVPGAGFTRAASTISEAVMEVVGNEARIEMVGLTLDVSSDTTIALNIADAALDAEVKAVDCHVLGNTTLAAINVGETACEIWLTRTRVEDGSISLAQTGGTIRMSQCRVGAGMLQNGTSEPMALYVDQCWVTGQANACVSLNAQQGEAVFTACDLVHAGTNVHGADIGQIAGAGNVQFADCIFDLAGTGGIAINVENPLANLVIDGCIFRDGDTAINCGANITCQGVSIMGNQCKAGVLNGLVWPTTSVPTQGILIVGNNFGAGVPIAGILVNTARVNIKANSGGGALLQETAIV